MTAAWPAHDPRLERRYRRLLLAYPRRYRHRHGAEIVTTLLEMAAPEQRHPRTWQALHLLGSGLRQRFRLPAGRPLAVVAAILVAVTTGAFGAAAGSWLGALTFADLPDDAAVAELTRRASGTGHDSIHRSPGSPWTQGGVSASSIATGGWDAERARQRFAAAGWTVSDFASHDGVAGIVEENPSDKPGAGRLAASKVMVVPTQGWRFVAESDGLTAIVVGSVVPAHGATGGPRGHVGVSISAAATPAFLPLVVIGGLAGLVGGWLLAASVAYRMRATSRPRRTGSAVLAGSALLCLALPAAALYGNVLRAFRDSEPGWVLTVHSAFTPGEYYPSGPIWSVAALSVAGAVLAVAAVLVPRPDTDPPPRLPEVADCAS